MLRPAMHERYAFLPDLRAQAHTLAFCATLCTRKVARTGPSPLSAARWEISQSKGKHTPYNTAVEQDRPSFKLRLFSCNRQPRTSTSVRQWSSRDSGSMLSRRQSIMTLTASQSAEWSLSNAIGKDSVFCCNSQQRRLRHSATPPTPPSRPLNLRIGPSTNSSLSHVLGLHSAERPLV